MEKIAVSAAKEAGVLLTGRFGKEAYAFKHRFDIVTDADVKSEKLIISRLKEKFPEHNYLSEEGGEENNGSKYTWVIDPLDGTNNFVRLIDEFCISIALLKYDKIVFGLVYQPVPKRLFVAKEGKGATLNAKKIRVGRENKLENMLASFDTPSKDPFRSRNADIIKKLLPEVRAVRCFGSSALHLARIAGGELDFYFKASQHLWDYAAGIIIVEEAGGKVTDFEGNAVNKDSKNILASNGKKHGELLRLINS